MELAHTISEVYRQQLAELHAARPDFGAGGAGQYDARKVLDLYGRYGCSSVLDYGCGKGWIQSQLPPSVDLRLYDPAMPEYCHLPQPADLVLCCDVMEHVEEYHIQDVIDHLRELARKAIYLSIALQPAQKTLPDGRNAHISLHSATEWLRRFELSFCFDEFHCDGTWLTITGRPSYGQS